MALITPVDEITQGLGNTDHVVGVFLDYSKAFDTLIILFYWIKCSSMAS